MKTLFRPLAAAALGVGAMAGTNYLTADDKKAPPADPPARALPAGRGANANPAGGDSKPDPTVAPVKITDTTVKTEFAVKPKDISDAVKKGLEYLVKGQQEDGGWNQGGGWRNNTAGGRVEGKEVEDPSDLGNTCFALLALLRAGNTAADGPYKDAVKKGLKFVVAKVERADKDSLYVTDVKGTQLQSKIGQYVDTFMANLVLAEYRGKCGDQEKAVAAALEKTMTKIVKHQTADGGFAGNAGWAPTLSVGLCNKGIARAKERGAAVDEVVLKRIWAQSEAAAAGTAAPKAVAAAEPATFGWGLFAFAPDGKTVVARGATYTADMARVPLAGFAGDAGVTLYRASQGAGNTQDVVNNYRFEAAKAREVIKDAKASKEDKDKAGKVIEELRVAEVANDKVQAQLAANVKNEQFVAGFGNNGGEEFLSFLNISESLVINGGKDWDEWDAKMVKGLEKAQDKDGAWQGHHCITGKTFCTAGALLVLMADRTPFPVEVIKAAKEKREAKPEAKK